MHVKKGDSVIVLAGKDKGATGKILRAFPMEDKVLVDGVNKKKVHQRPKKTGEKGSIIEKLFPIHVSNVKLSTIKAKAKAKKPAVKADKSVAKG